MKKFLPIIIGIGITILAVWLVSSDLGLNDTTPNDQTDTPSTDSSDVSDADVLSFSFRDYQGNTVTAADFRGTPIIVNSWASWCPFCVDELPDLGTVQAELGDRVIFIGINRAESLTVSQSYTNDLAGAENLVYLLDPDDLFYESIGGFSMPETLFIDADGVVQLQRRGQMGLDEIRQRANELVN